MVVPLIARSVAAVVGAALVLTAGASVVGTLIVPRPVGGWLTRMVDRVVVAAFRLLTAVPGGYRTRDWVLAAQATRDVLAAQAARDRVLTAQAARDRVLAAQAPAILLAQLAAWLGVSFVGYALLLWPFATGGIGSCFVMAGESVFTLGSGVPHGAAPIWIVFAAALTGLVIVTLQIAYLPTLYSAFNRRETEVALLNARAGVPSWGPELLARTHYALGSGVSTIDALPEFYELWERWAADVTESHTTYLPLVRFRSPRPLSSWVTALLAVLDSAALYLALSPQAAPEVPARLCLRSGFLCFRQIAQAMGISVPDEPGPDDRVSLTYEEFLEAIARLRAVDFPIERDRDLPEAWEDFAGWRVNYEAVAYAIAAAVDAVPALWSGPRRYKMTPIAPIRPAKGRPPK